MKGVIKAALESSHRATIVFVNPQGNEIPILSLNKKEIADLQRQLTRLWKEME